MPQSKILSFKVNELCDAAVLQDGSTPLMIASYKGHADIVKKHIKAAIEQINYQREVYRFEMCITV